jgi:hypothetical protein
MGCTPFRFHSDSGKLHRVHPDANNLSASDMVAAVMESCKHIKWQWQRADSGREDLDQMMKMTQEVLPALHPLNEPDIIVDPQVHAALERLMHWVNKAKVLTDKLMGMAGLPRLLMGSNVQNRINYVEDGLAGSL